MKNINHNIAHALLKTLNNPAEPMIELGDPVAPFMLLWRTPLLASTGVCAELYRIQKTNNGFLIYYARDYKNLPRTPHSEEARLQADLISIMD